MISCLVLFWITLSSSVLANSGVMTFFNAGLNFCAGQNGVPDYSSGGDYIVAAAASLYSSMGSGNLCGRKVCITHNGVQKVAIVTDQCPECPMYNLDASQGLFGSLGNFDQGILNIDWHFCDEPSDDEKKKQEEEEKKRQEEQARIDAEKKAQEQAAAAAAQKAKEEADAAAAQKAKEEADRKAKEQQDEQQTNGQLFSTSGSHKEPTRKCRKRRTV